MVGRRWMSFRPILPQPMWRFYCRWALWSLRWFFDLLVSLPLSPLPLPSSVIVAGLALTLIWTKEFVNRGWTHILDITRVANDAHHNSQVTFCIAKSKISLSAVFRLFWGIFVDQVSDWHGRGPPYLWTWYILKQLENIAWWKRKLLKEENYILTDTNKISTFVVVRVIISGAGCQAGLLVDAPPVHRVCIAGLYWFQVETCHCIV